MIELCVQYYSHLDFIIYVLVIMSITITMDHFSF